MGYSKCFVLLSIILFFGVEVFGKCAHSAVMENQFKQNPNLKKQLEDEEKSLESVVQKNLRESRQVNPIYTIPTVVHVIYRTNSENIPDGVIVDQIARLNIDYRRLNDQSKTVSQFKNVEADSGIQFILAETDPLGNPSNGITRTQTNVVQFSDPNNNNYNHDCQHSNLGGADAWPRTKYMNIWICNFTGGVLGFAQTPGFNTPNATDGIVIRTNAFGATADAPYNLGRTLTHESGHWFNMKHPWGDGGANPTCTADDLVADTPIISGPNYECDLQKISCGNLNMVQNYMDYPDDACMTLFSAGQIARMRAEFDPVTGRRATVAILDYNGTVIGLDNYVSPYGDNTQNDSDSGIDFTKGIPFYVIIGVASCLAITICLGILVKIARCTRRR